MLISVVGNRPQFIKLAPLAQEWRARGLRSLTVHSDQHFDENMSGVFFTEMGIPPPDVHLAVRERSHAKLTGEIMGKLEDLFVEKQPSGILVFGDTNTTLAAALAAVKLQIPLAHVESGPRIYDMRTPEEINRIVADHASSLRFCPDALSVDNLRKENIIDGVLQAGDPMYDSFLHFMPHARRQSTLLARYQLGDRPFTLLTVHRPNNTDNPGAVSRLVELCASLREPVLFAVHPRTRAALERNGLWHELEDLAHVRLTPPLGYLDVLAALAGCSRVVTDSGGLQKEAAFARKPAIVLFHASPWPRLVEDGWVRIAGSLADTPVTSLLAAIRSARPPAALRDYFGDGHAAGRIVDALMEYGFFDGPRTRNGGGSSA